MSFGLGEVYFSLLLRPKDMGYKHWAHCEHWTDIVVFSEHCTLQLY